MSMPLPLPQISTNVRLAASRLLSPELAGAWAERLFLTPPVRRNAAASALELIDARSELLVHKGRHIGAWRWGSMDAPAVLLVHGWGGNAAQMRPLVFPLLSAGYRVIAYDQPAHGISEGQLTGLPDFADVLAELASHYGPVHGTVAHSMGAAGTALALARGVPLGRVVLIGASLDVFGYARSFARWYWLSEGVRHAMQDAVEERFGMRWADLEMEKIAPRLRAPALLIHDRNDRAVPWEHGARFARLWPGARLLTTHGLGHQRILKDEAVGTAAADFIAGRSELAVPCAD